jgi:hypothetical protein
MTMSIFHHVWPRAPRRRPSVVSSTLQAHLLFAASAPAGRKKRRCDLRSPREFFLVGLERTRQHRVGPASAVIGSARGVAAVRDG